MKRISSLIIPILVLTGCTPKQRPEELHNYHEIKDRLIDWDNVFNQVDDDYLVYFYSERCGHCNEIKQDIIKFYLNEYMPMYFVCTDYQVVVGPRSDLTGIDNINDFYIFGTPFLLRLLEHKVSNYYVGTHEILNYISTF